MTNPESKIVAAHIPPDQVEDSKFPRNRPAWLRLVDEEEIRELEDRGVDLEREIEKIDPGVADAFASFLLHRISVVESDIHRHETARDMEQAALARRYDNILTPLDSRRRGLAAAVLYYTERAIFEGKAKSRKILWGIFGRRIKKGALEIVDGAEESVVAQLKEKAPSCLRYTVTLTGNQYDWLRVFIVDYERETSKDDGATVAIIATTQRAFDGAKVEVSRSQLTDFLKLQAENRDHNRRIEIHNASSDPAFMRSPIPIVEIVGARIAPDEDRPYFEIHIPTVPAIP